MVWAGDDLAELVAVGHAAVAAAAGEQEHQRAEFGRSSSMKARAASVAMMGHGVLR
jgi:hypothetical protein